MSIRTEDFEKLGTFYLGRPYDLETKTRGDGLLLYDSKDLVTHGVVLGMTGSGKTGLCLALLEEAAIDGVPAIVIDPKGDIANLLLTFPDLKAADFRPWINEDDARRKGLDPDAFAAAQADAWAKGLAESGQDGQRIARLRSAVEIALYTPGSNAGLPVSTLSSLECPPPEVADDAEAMADRIESTVSSLLALLGIDADPLQSREHLVLSNIFRNAWSQGLDLDLPGLIQSLQHPPFDQVGVMPLDSLFPEKDRMALALRLNNLLAAPGFDLWLEGEALEPSRLLHTAAGKPRVAIFSIAHLGDAGRMFFVSLLLNQIVAWMRAQSGTTSLRALVYMDEIAGYLPPTAAPPSKKPMLTLLKQARAFGVGVLLATQNPVDLDYKALSNIGTWFLGRLQTERDKLRVLDGLEGSAAGQAAGFDRTTLEKTLSALGNRVFLMNNVHEDEPVVFETRWVMSYLAGPLTRAQLKVLADPMRAAQPAAAGKGRPAAEVVPGKPAAGGGTMVKPPVAKQIDEFFLPLPPGSAPADFVYQPRVLRAGRIVIEDAKLGVSLTDETCDLVPIAGGRAAADWKHATALDADVSTLSRAAVPGVAFQSLPKEFGEAKFYTAAKRDYADQLAREGGVDLLRSPSLGEVSQPGEHERDFRLRLVQKAREMRDERVRLLREDYAKRLAREQDDVGRAQAAVEREKAQAATAKWSTLASVGSALLGTFMGRKKISVTNLRRVGTVGTSMSRTLGQSRDVNRAEEKLAAELEDVAKLEEELQGKIREIESTIDPVTETLESVRLRPMKKNVSVQACGLAWVPVAR